MYAAWTSQEHLAKDDARQQFLRILRSLPYGNSVFFSVRKIDDPTGLLPGRIILGINKRGVSCTYWKHEKCFVIKETQISFLTPPVKLKSEIKIKKTWLPNCLKYTFCLTSISFLVKSTKMSFFDMPRTFDFLPQYFSNLHWKHFMRQWLTSTSPLLEPSCTKVENHWPTLSVATWNMDL